MHISDNGYFAHFNVGFLIGGLVSYLIFKKTGNKIKSLVFGILIATFFGVGKELIDPYLGRDVDLLDFTSNGFKLRRTHASQNANDELYIYLAFAENPFVSSEGTPTTAR